MVSKNFNINIIVRAGLLSVSSILASVFLLQKEVILVGIFLAVIFIFQVIELINYVNRTNRKIAYFFDAIRNDDSTLSFPENAGSKSLSELNASLNKVNELIKNIKFELIEQEQYYKTILEHISVGIISFNEKGAISLSNSAARNMLEYEHLTHINQIKRTDNKLFTGIKELRPGDHRLVSFNGRQGVIQLLLKSTLFKSSHENLQLVTIQDIKNELETKELESWIKLIRVLTHEIMNSVAPITSLSQTILGYYKSLDGNLPSEKIIGNTIKGLEVINERGIGLIRFVETYRKLTRLPQPKKKQVALSRLFDSTITLINLEPVDEKIQINWDVKPSDLEIVADKEQIVQVLINLLKNSIEAIKNNPKGTINLKAIITANGRVQITITDNGVGIPDELHDKIFIPFFTTKESGSGVGLSLSRQIMQMHGGSLKLVSVPGKETSAILSF